MRRWTDEELAEAVASGTSRSDAIGRLGLAPRSGGTHAHIKKRIGELGLDTSHWNPWGTKRDDQTIVEATANCTNLSEVTRYLGCSNGRPRQQVRQRIKELGLDTSHWDQSGRRKGARGLEDYLSNKYPISSPALRQKLIDSGTLEDRCNRCGLTEWRGESISLHLEHVDGNHANNVLSNLEILCPNCHSQTPTYAKGKRR